MKHSVLLDTSFFIRLLNDEDPLHKNAIGYYRYFLEKDIALKFSTISIAEYCVLGNITDLPLRNLQVIPFNTAHAERTGVFARILFEENKISTEKLNPRAIIPNDSKLFAQADLDISISFFITSDFRSKKTWERLKNRLEPTFQIITIDSPHHLRFGMLDL